MEWIDVSLPLKGEYPVWPVHIPFTLRYSTRIEEGVDANNTYFQMYSHFGTHIDALNHFIIDGQTIDSIPLNLLIGACRVYQLDCKVAIDESDLKNLNFNQVKRVIFKTNNSKRIHDREFHKDYIGVTTAGARFLVRRGIKLLGIDYYSVGLFSEPTEAHRVFLGSGGIVIEF